MIERSQVRVPAGLAGVFSSPESTFCGDSYFGIRSTLCNYSSTQKTPAILPKVQVQLINKHAYILRVWLCMKYCDMVHGIVYTDHAETAVVSRGTSHVTTEQRRMYTSSVDFQIAL